MNFVPKNLVYNLLQHFSQYTCFPSFYFFNNNFILQTLPEMNFGFHYFFLDFWYPLAYELVGIKIGYKGYVESISDEHLGKKGKNKILVLKFLKKVKF